MRNEKDYERQESLQNIADVYRAPETNTSEIIADFQRRVPMDVQWQFPTEFRVQVVCSKGLSLVQWISTETAQWVSSGAFRWMFMFV